MVSLGELQDEVAERYDRLRLPSWPNPHPDGQPALDEEYSRVTDPGRYRIVHERARAWTESLASQAGVEVETLAPAAVDEDGHFGLFDRGLRLTSQRPETFPLFLLERDAMIDGREDRLAVLHINVLRSNIGVQMLPDCGCDACDWGSDDLLWAIDETITHIVGGPFVVLRGQGWSAQWYPDGGSSSGTERPEDHRTLLELCRQLADGQDVRLPPETDAFIGRSWVE